jgi:hypothetical protein
MTHNIFRRLTKAWHISGQCIAYIYHYLDKWSSNSNLKKCLKEHGLYVFAFGMSIYPKDKFIIAWLLC